MEKEFPRHTAAVIRRLTSQSENGKRNKNTCPNKIKKLDVCLCVCASFNDFFYDIVSEQYNNVAMLPSPYRFSSLSITSNTRHMNQIDLYTIFCFLSEQICLWKFPNKIGFFNVMQTCLCDKFSRQEIYDMPQLQSNSLNSLLGHVTSL